MRLLELGRDLPSLWNHDAATAEMKKRILRTVLEEIMIGDDAARTTHLLVLHWKGGVHTEVVGRSQSVRQEVRRHERDGSGVDRRVVEGLQRPDDRRDAESVGLQDRRRKDVAVA